MPDKVLVLVDAIRSEINRQIGQYLQENSLDYYTMVYSEENKAHTIEVSFNAGDIRTLKIILDIDPDA